MYCVENDIVKVLRFHWPHVIQIADLLTNIADSGHCPCTNRKLGGNFIL